MTTDRQGDWVDNYGADGYVLAGWYGPSGDLAGLPAGISYTLQQGTRVSGWPSPTTDVRALESPDQSERRARTWYDSSRVRVRLDFSSAYSGSVHLYAVDWDTTVRRQDVTVDDGAGPRTLGLTANFGPGAWLHFPVDVPAGGSLSITVDNRNAAVNAVLSGIFLGGAGTPLTVPGAPTLAPAVAGDGTIQLGWTAPASDGGSPISAYKVYRGTTSGGETLLATLGNETSYDDTSAANGTTYYYSVSAVNSVGEGAWSNERSATPVAPLTVPGAPTGLVGTPGDRRVILNWTAPTSDGGSPITGYRVYRGTVSATKTLIATLGNVATFTDTGRTNGTRYYYEVAARNAIGDGAHSAEISVVPATVPSSPRSFTAKTSKTLGVDLTWGVPSSNGGASILGYRIYRGTTSGNRTFLVQILPGTSYADTTTVPGVRYYYMIGAFNDIGITWSRESSAVAK